MKHFLLALSLALFTPAIAIASNQPAMIFSQDVIAINADGSRIPQVKINPQEMADIQTHDFDLGSKRLLRIHTNISNAEERGLADVAATVRRCYSYIEETTGQELRRGVMLYLIELDVIPYAYSFQATYDDASQWGEVRLALIEGSMPLTGRGTPASLSDLLYDTLPHELGHDALEGISQLMHDIDGNTSQHTRWFIEGSCEVLAKGFSLREVPALHHRYLALRNIDTVLAEAQMRSDLLNWAQDNSNGMAHESDLYGAVRLTMMAWTDSITLNELLGQVAARSGSVRGTELLAMMKSTSGIGPQEMFNLAHAHGQRLNEKLVLAQLEIR